jgi:hypothetical protein
MSAEFLEHAPPLIQVFYWIGLGAAVALMSTVYKWAWRALGYLWNHRSGPPSVREYPVQWRPPEPPSQPNPDVDRAVVGEEDGKDVDDGRRPAWKPPWEKFQRVS